MNSNDISRRQFLVLAGATLVACASEDRMDPTLFLCDDPNSLTDDTKLGS